MNIFHINDAMEFANSNQFHQTHQMDVQNQLSHIKEKYNIDGDILQIIADKKSSKEDKKVAISELVTAILANFEQTDTFDDVKNQVYYDLSNAQEYLDTHHPEYTPLMQALDDRVSKLGQDQNTGNVFALGTHDDADVKNKMNGLINQLVNALKEEQDDPGTIKHFDKNELYPVVVLLVISIGAIKGAMKMTEILNSFIKNCLQQAVNRLNKLSALAAWFQSLYQMMITEFNKEENTKKQPNDIADIKWASGNWYHVLCGLFPKDHPEYQYIPQGIKVQLTGNHTDGSFPKGIFKEVTDSHGTYAIVDMETVKSYIDETSKIMAAAAPGTVNKKDGDSTLTNIIYPLMSGFNTSTTAVTIINNDISNTNSSMTQFVQENQSEVQTISQYFRQFESASNLNAQVNVWRQ